MGSTKVACDKAKEILNHWGYREFTELQKLVFRNCGCEEAAREFVIGSTSSGKTLIPLICYEADKREARRRNKLLYIIPYRALATQKEKEIRQKFPKENVVVSTSEYCSDDINVLNANCDIAIVIYEKVFMFISNNKGFFEQYSHIVFDELGVIESAERGLKADYILYMACNCKRSNVYVLATPYFNWEKYIDRYEFTKHRELSRPVEIYNTIVEYSVGNVGSEWEEEDNKILELCKKHRELGHKILVFVNSRSRARDYSRKIYQSFENNPEDGFNAKKEFLSRVVMTEDDLYGIMDQEDYLAYSAGITFHNASLPEEIRELIEKDFLDDAGCIDIVVATETLAYGLNSNVDVVIVAEMEKPVGRGEKRFLSVNEYQNFIGRAGRLGKKNIGYAYTFINSVQKDSWDELISKIASPDLIESQYKNIWEREECIFHLLNYFDSKDGTELDTVCSVLENYPYRDNGEPAKMETAIEDMQERHLIKSEVDELEEKELYSVTKIGRRALGFIVSLDTYDRLLDATKKLFKNKNIVMFDFIYAICQCKELLIRDYFNKDKACDYRSQFLNVVNKWQEDGVISKACRLSITSHPSFDKFKNKYNNPSPYDYTFLRQVRMAEALYMWIQCFSVEEIQRKCGFEYGNIKKIGEKAKYITDILSAEISVSGDIRELEISLKRLGLAFYYGIRTEIIEKLDVLELEPMDGRQLRTVGRVINIRENFSKAKQHKLEELQKQIESFPQQYQDLLGR